MFSLSTLDSQLIIAAKFCNVAFSGSYNLDATIKNNINTSNVISPDIKYLTPKITTVAIPSLSTSCELTTNNQMEITAALNGLKALKEPCKVDIYTDSAYVCNAFLQNWIYGWLKNGWVNSKKEPVKNKELWHELYEMTLFHNVTWHKVKGHADNVYNNRCDKLATTEYKNKLNA